MKSSGTNEFWQLYRELPDQVREATRRTYRIWRVNPRASGVRFKKVRDVYSVRIGHTGYRAIAIDVPDGFLWIWIGPHDQYERLLNS
ncbi:MAG: hypothetical protein V7609_3507 [Verrucomicrobiota bacterium]